MKMQKKKLIFATLIFLLFPISIQAASTVPLPSGMKLTSYSSYRICEGVTQENITITNNGHKINEYILTVNLKNPNVGFMTSYYHLGSGLKKKNFTLSTVRNQANYAIKKTGRNVVAAVNGDFFNSSGKPDGLVIMNHKEIFNGNNSYHFLALLENNEVVLRESNEAWDDVVEGIGFPNLLMKDYKLQFGADMDYTWQPRTAMGIRENGQIVFLIADGRSTTSVGLSLYDLALQLKALGCRDGAMLDGGGSSTLVSRYPSEEVLSIKNTPADKIERKVGSSLLIYYKKPAINLSACQAKVKTAYYTGSNVKPPVTLTYQGKTIPSTDYSVSYFKNKKFGYGYVIIKGNGKSAVTGRIRVDFPITLGKSTSVTAKAYANLKGIGVKWTAVPGAGRYYLYRKGPDDTSFKKIATLKSKVTSYKDTEVAVTQKYEYRIRAYNVSHKIKGGSTTSAITCLKPQNVGTITTKRTKKKIVLNYNVAKKTDGYIIYRRTGTTGKYKKIYETTNIEKIKYTDKKVSKSKTYYYKICSYKYFNQKTYYSTKKIKVKGL